MLRPFSQSSFLQSNVLVVVRRCAGSAPPKSTVPNDKPQYAPNSFLRHRPWLTNATVQVLCGCEGWSRRGGAVRVPRERAAAGRGGGARVVQRQLLVACECIMPSIRTLRIPASVHILVLYTSSIY